MSIYLHQRHTREPFATHPGSRTFYEVLRSKIILSIYIVFGSY